MTGKNVAVAKFSDLKNGEMKEVSADGTNILVARVEDKCYAVGANCPHYGAPLAEGFLSGTRIVCPWHHACFDVTTGDLEEPPAFDSLPKFDLSIDGDEVIVHIPDNAPDRREPEFTIPAGNDSRVFVIVGGGAAGFMAAQTLREDGFAGRIVMITREDRAPYDRPNLSKDYLHGHADPAWMPLRSDDFYAEREIEILFKTEVEKVDASAKTVVLKGGDTLGYDSLLIATGGIPRTLDLSGSDLKNIFVLRSFDSADEIIAAAETAQKVAVIGASFIGMEAASSLTKRGKFVTVIAPDEVPFQKTLGREIGELFQKEHEANGVKFRLGSSVKGFDGDGYVRKVLLQSGEQIDADLVIAGVGVRPATDLLKGFDRHKDGGVITDQFLSLGDDIYAAGDIVHFPDRRTGEHTRIEHWRTALQQGRIAARNMAGKATAFTAVPFFWTTQFDVTLNYVGHAVEWDGITYDGDLGSKDFLAFYSKAGRILAVAGMNRDREIDIWEEKFRTGDA